MKLKLKLSDFGFEAPSNAGFPMAEIIDVNIRIQAEQK